MNNPTSIFNYNGYKILFRTGTVDAEVIDQSFDSDIFYREIPDLITTRESTILDVGAHIGTFSIYSFISGKAKSVLAIEPNSDSFHILQQNILTNKLEGNIIPLKYAVSSEEGQVRLFLDRDNWGHSLTNSSLSTFEEVSATTVEKLFQSYNVNICQLAKFNCEGAEFKIILSLSPSTLEKIAMMIILFHEDLVGEGLTRQHLLDFLKQNGFFVRLSHETDQRGWIIAKNKKYYSQANHIIVTSYLKIKHKIVFLKDKVSRIFV